MVAQHRSRDRDVCELFRRRFGNHGAVCEKERPVNAERGIFFRHDLHGRNGFDTFLAGNELKHGAEGVGRNRCGTADHGVCRSREQHHAGEIIRRKHVIGCFGFIHSVEALHAFEFFYKFGQFRRARRLDDADSVEAHVEARRDCFDARAVSDKHGNAEAARGELARCLNDADVRAFGEDNAFRVILEACRKFINKRHRIFSSVF